MQDKYVSLDPSLASEQARTDRAHLAYTRLREARGGD